MCWTIMQRLKMKLVKYDKKTDSWVWVKSVQVLYNSFNFGCMERLIKSCGKSWSKTILCVLLLIIAILPHGRSETYFVFIHQVFVKRGTAVSSLALILHRGRCWVWFPSLGPSPGSPSLGLAWCPKLSIAFSECFIGKEVRITSS